MRDLEHQMAVAFYRWWILMARANKVNDRLLFAIPNGGDRHPAVAAKLKAEGVRAGVADYLLAVPRDGFFNGAYHGLYIELKAGGPGIRRGTQSPDQKEFEQAMRSKGYAYVLAYGTNEACAAVEDYLGWGRAGNSGPR